MNEFSADVIVIGSGAGGAAVAGELGRNGVSVKVLEMGPVITTSTGGQARNPDSRDSAMPAAIEFFSQHYQPHSGHDTFLESLPGLGAIRGVGGLFTSWSNNAPTHDASELPVWLDQARWTSLVERAQDLLRVSASICDHDPRTSLLLEHFRRVVGPLPAGREVQNMPISASWDGVKLHFAGTDDLLAGSGSRVEILPNRIARRIHTKGGRAISVEAVARDGNQVEMYSGGHVVVAGGTVGSAQVIAASDLDAGPALGAYLMEHVALATRISLKPEFRTKLDVEGPTFALWAPVSPAHPWHCQVTRHLMDYINVLPPTVDPKNTADLIAFCPIEPQVENALSFDLSRLDAFGLPLMDGRIALSTRDKAITARALSEQFLVASELGDLDHGWASKLIPRGGSTHLMGSCRMGLLDDGTSVVDTNGRMWRYENVHVAGNAVFSSANAGNPSLTGVAFALQTADDILGRSNSLVSAHDAEPTRNRAGVFDEN